MADEHDLVSVYRAANTIEARFVKNLLQEQGIRATVSEENEPFAGLPVVPPDVLVRAEDQARATAVVEEYDRRKAERPDTESNEDG